MESKTLTCICCPVGCQITIKLEENKIKSLTGNTCQRGGAYARREITSPERIVTTTVRVTGGDAKMVPVKTKDPIPKDKIFDCIQSLRNVTATAPVHVGDVILQNAAETGVDITATKNVAAVTGVS
nr:DUF1667 domain-containing protein [uncultured Mediterraneibacter sp.]